MSLLPAIAQACSTPDYGECNDIIMLRYVWPPDNICGRKLVCVHLEMWQYNNEYDLYGYQPKFGSPCAYYYVVSRFRLSPSIVQV